MVLLHFFDTSQTRLTDFGYIPECKSKSPRGLNEISLPLARMNQKVKRLASILNETLIATFCGTKFIKRGKVGVFTVELQWLEHLWDQEISSR